MLISTNYIFSTIFDMNISSTSIVISTVFFVVFWVLFIWLGVRLIVKGARENKAWKIIIGIFLTGIIWGLIIWGVVVFTNKEKISRKQQITSPPRSRRKTTSRQKTKKS